MDNRIFVSTSRGMISKLYIATVTPIHSEESLEKPNGILIGVMNGEEIALYGDEANNFLDELVIRRTHKEVSLPAIK